MQSISSKDTSIAQVSKAITTYQTKIGFTKGSTILDYGGGRYDLGIAYMKARGCNLVVYDPYWRTQQYNQHSIDVFKKHPDYITCANVLNVIKENNIVEDVVSKIRRLSRPGTVVIFSIYEGNGTGIGKRTTKGWQRNQKIDSYMPLIRSYFPNAVKRYGIVIAVR